jgi:hypothetical protein
MLAGYRFKGTKVWLDFQAESCFFGKETTFAAFLSFVMARGMEWF